MKIDVKHIAKLANLPLSENEEKGFKQQLEETINYISKLNEIDTTNERPTYQTNGPTNVTRKDEICPSLSQEEALKNSKSKENGFFKVNAILNQD